MAGLPPDMGTSGDRNAKNCPRSSSINLLSLKSFRLPTNFSTAQWPMAISTSSKTKKGKRRLSGPAIHLILTDYISLCTPRGGVLVKNEFENGKSRD